jgi:hypothetical protein
MGLIKEPLDVDFVVDPRPLTDKERKMISDFIRTDKLKRANIASRLKTKKASRQKERVN